MLIHPIPQQRLVTREHRPRKCRPSCMQDSGLCTTRPAAILGCRATLVVSSYFLNRCLHILGQVLDQALAPAFPNGGLTC